MTRKGIKFERQSDAVEQLTPKAKKLWDALIDKKCTLKLVAEALKDIYSEVHTNTRGRAHTRGACTHSLMRTCTRTRTRKRTARAPHTRAPYAHATPHTRAARTHALCARTHGGVYFAGAWQRLPHL